MYNISIIILIVFLSFIFDYAYGHYTFDGNVFGVYLVDNQIGLGDFWIFY